jgi:hypothetical protein
LYEEYQDKQGTEQEEEMGKLHVCHTDVTNREEGIKKH